MPVGVLHLDPIPKFDPPKGMSRFLLDVIRKAAGKVGRDRNMTLEDYYHDVFSYMPIAENAYLVRCAAVNEYGRSMDSMVNSLPVLMDTLLHMGRRKYLVIGPNEDRYDHFYNTFRFGNTLQARNLDYLYTPDLEPLVKTRVVLRRRFEDK